MKTIGFVGTVKLKTDGPRGKRRGTLLAKEVVELPDDNAEQVLATKKDACDITPTTLRQAIRDIYGPKPK